MTRTTDLLALAERLGQTAGWYVVVCPTAEATGEARRNLAGAAPAGSEFSGRTARFPNGGRMTVIGADESPDFIPEGTPVKVAFLGWEQADDGSSKRMAPWRKIAQEVVRFR